MTIAFNSVPSNIRVPLFTVEFDNSRASPGPAGLAYRALLIGQKIPSGTWDPNTLQQVTNADQVATGAGRGSMLHRMALAWFAENKTTEAWVGVLDDSPAGVIGEGQVAFTGTATAAGTIKLYAGGEQVNVGVAVGDTASVIAAAIAEALGQHASGTVTFATAEAGDNITVGGTTFVGSTGAVTPGAATYSVDTGNSNAASSFAAQVNAHAIAGKLVRATPSAAVVTLRARAGGPGGNSIVLTSVDGSTTAVTGAGTLTGASSDTDLPVHAYAASGTTHVLARNAGEAMNEYDLRLNYQPGDALPAGVSAVITAMSGGTTNPTLTSLIATMGDRWYQILGLPYTDATSLGAMEDELARRFGPMAMIDGFAIAAKNDTHANLATLGNSRNSPHVSIVSGYKSPTPPFEYAASAAGVVALYGNIDPARPFQTLPLTWVLPPAEADQFTITERNLLLYDGISVTKSDAGGTVILDRVITTYKTNSAGTPDVSYLDANTMLTLMYMRYSLRADFTSKYPRHKLGDDGNRFGAGQAVVTPSVAKAEALLWFDQMVELGLGENAAQFKADLVVERDATDRTRLNMLVSPDLVNQFIVGAVKMQFIL